MYGLIIPQFRFIVKLQEVDLACHTGTVQSAVIHCDGVSKATALLLHHQVQGVLDSLTVTSSTKD